MGKNLKGKEIGKNISQRSDGRYIVRMVVDGKRECKYFRRVADARAYVEQYEHQKKNGIDSDHPILTFKEMGEFWIKTYRKGKVKPNTLYGYEHYMGMIDETVLNMPMYRIKQYMLQEALNKLADKGYSFSTLNSVRVVMHQIYKCAIANDFVRIDPSMGLILPTDVSKEKKPLTTDEQAKFFEYAKECKLYNALKFALLTGMRSGEVSGAKWSDIDFERKELKILRAMAYDKKTNIFHLTTPKTKTSIRTIPLTEEMIQILKDREEEQKKDKLLSKKWCTNDEFSDLIFTTKNGNPLGQSAYNNAIKSVIRRINKDIMISNQMNGTSVSDFESFSMHNLRHTFSTTCSENGMDAKTIQALLGHATINTTMEIYTHTNNQYLHQQMNQYGVKMVSGI